MLIALLTTLTLLGQSTELDQATADCERDVAACARRDALRERQREQDRVTSAQKDEERATRAAAALARVQAEEAQESQALAERRKRCGKSWMSVRVGMKFATVAQCAGPFTMIAEVPRGQLWEAEGGRVIVAKGAVVAWERFTR